MSPVTADEPYVTVRVSPEGFTPTRFDPHPHGYLQVSDVLPTEADFIDAKRAAVSWAASMSLPYKVPV